MKPRKQDLRPERVDLRLEMAHFRLEWAHFRPERADLDEMINCKRPSKQMLAGVRCRSRYDIERGSGKIAPNPHDFAHV